MSVLPGTAKDTGWRTGSIPRVRDAGATIWRVVRTADPRIPFAVLLTMYAVLGLTVLRFNRTPMQMLVTVLSACALEIAFARILRGRWIMPISAWITGVSLAILLNYSRDSFILFLPVFLSIASKYVLTYEGKHVFNPSMFGVAVSLLIGGDLVGTAPAYQWGGTLAMSAFLVMAALFLFVFRIGRTPLIVAFLGFYGVQILFRAWLMRWYLPPESLILGTLSSAPFFLFVFYMITDPKTSPAKPRDQVKVALALTLVDLFFHTRGSVYTFFYAALSVAAARFIFLHARRMLRRREVAVSREWIRAAALAGTFAGAMFLIYVRAVEPGLRPVSLRFRLDRLDPLMTQVEPRMDGSIIAAADPRVQHIAKWLLSAGDAASVGDYDNDGLLDLFLCGPFKASSDRAILYRNTGGFRFERVSVPALAEMSGDPAKHGIVSSGTFADPDNDGDQDLFLTVGYGTSRLLQNQLAEEGVPRFVDISTSSGVADYSISIAANYLDYDQDGRLDLFVANALNPWLGQYHPPRPLNIFRLQAPEYEGDRRMLSFMHESWDNARNGGLNYLYRNEGGRFSRVDSLAAGMPETHWSLVAATGDLDHDGRTDLYVANDFGPDDLYMNEGGGRFRRVSGRVVGEVGRDTYKGMNASMGDIDRNGYLDVYVSNVHVPLQAEGSNLWMTRPSRKGTVEFRDEATQRGALNEHRFGWGGAIGDLDNDGWLDIVQANGMIDDRFDRRFPECRDYWYVNEKLMRSGPEIHTYADMWGDLRGYCINGRESNRVYLSRGDHSRLQFFDAAPALGWGDEPPSRGVLLADLDNDGDLDVGVTHITDSITLYRNSRNDDSSARWIGLDLRGNGTSCNADAAGSKVTISYDENGRTVRQYREVSIVNAFAAQGDRRVLFGLGNYSGPIDVTIRWCGASETATRLEPNRYHRIEQNR